MWGGGGGVEGGGFCMKQPSDPHTHTTSDCKFKPQSFKFQNLYII